MIPLFDLPEYVQCQICDIAGCEGELEFEETPGGFMQKCYYRCKNTGLTFQTEKSMQYVLENNLPMDAVTQKKVNRAALINAIWGVAVVLLICLIAYLTR